MLTVSIMKVAGSRQHELHHDTHKHRAVRILPLGAPVSSGPWVIFWNPTLESRE